MHIYIYTYILPNPAPYMPRFPLFVAASSWRVGEQLVCMYGYCLGSFLVTAVTCAPSVVLVFQFFDRTRHNFGSVSSEGGGV